MFVTESIVWLLLYTAVSVPDAPDTTILSPCSNPWSAWVNVAVTPSDETFAVPKSPIPTGLLSDLL